MEIYDEEDLSEYERERQRNIISNYEFMRDCGKNILYQRECKLISIKFSVSR